MCAFFVILKAEFKLKEHEAYKNVMPLSFANANLNFFYRVASPGNEPDDKGAGQRRQIYWHFHWGR